MANAKPIDDIDLKILDELQRNGRAQIQEVAQKVNLTKTPCLMRIRRLEADGYIQGYRAEINPKLIDQDYVVFVQVKLVATTRPVLDKFNKAVVRAPEIQACYMMAGGFDYLLQVRTTDMTDYTTLMSDVIATLPGIHQTTTFPVMKAVKETAALNLNGRLRL